MSNKRKKNDTSLSAVWFFFLVMERQMLLCNVNSHSFLGDRTDVAHMCSKVFDFLLNISTTCLNVEPVLFSRLFVAFLWFPPFVWAHRNLRCPYSLFSGYENVLLPGGMASDKPLLLATAVSAWPVFLGHEFLKMCQQKLHRCLAGRCSQLDRSASPALCL